MIPQIKHSPQISPLTLRYLQALRDSGFGGDIATDYASRLSLATDNSIYQLLPQAILFPRNIDDITLLTTLAQQSDYHAIRFTPRGGGTGTNGQSLNHDIIVDLSRHMNRILAIDVEQGWVKVEAGVVKDQLNQYLAPYGYFFSPELSTSNRATIGGMISTDASGQGSMVYGKTSDHTLALKAVLLTGDILQTGKQSLTEVADLLAQTTPIADIYRTVFNYCRDHRALILDCFPKLNRFLTGYDLKHVFNDEMTEFDLTRLITGSEGTLAFVAEATLRIIPLPKVRYLINIKYDSFQSALKHAPWLVEAKALSVETVDSKVLNLAKQDIIWQSVQNLITDVKGYDLQGINIVEFAGQDFDEVNAKFIALCQQLDRLLEGNAIGVIGYQTCDQLAEINKIYAMRKKAVGLLGNAQGAQKPIPFVEDTCVPPEHLADYIMEFRALLDQHHLTYGMFGHVDSGVLHVRPALDLCNSEQRKLIRTLSDRVVELTAKYGGLLWGEHGKGLRSEYSPAFFGETLYHGLRTIKAAFDPNNRLNPGKICVPLTIDEPLYSIESTGRGEYDQTIPIRVKQVFHGAMECNGNGLCFNFDINSPMCPSMKISANRVYSPKGRAALVREWLRLLVEQGMNEHDINTIYPQKRGSLIELAKRLTNTINAKRGEYDFSHEVKQSMSYCLSCKACSTQCPIKIDVPDFKARFLQLYHTRYLRPLKDYAVGHIETLLPLMAKTPRFFNVFMRLSVTDYLSRKMVGMTSLPLLSYPTLKQQLAGHHSANITLPQLKALTVAERQQYVLIVQDPFTSYYDAKVVSDFVKLAEKLGFKPVVLPFIPNGKAQHIKGFLAQFAKTAKSAADALTQIAALGMPMVGVDPALVLCYRDEYQQMLQDDKGDFTVLLSHEWLAQLNLPLQGKEHQAVSQWYLLGHCSETTQLPASRAQWQAIFAHFGANLHIVDVGCCGMAGTYGHELANLHDSEKLYQLSWQQALAKYPSTHCLTTGYSCRSQVKRFEKLVLKHPLQALLALIEQHECSATAI
ncbi:FAD/FMN-containing dehydrogenase [Orbus hercynius]|uniref:D-2-hydroxyglutarate dehydrogenase n=1 Tax=Orbus hercynius TaxID=593135 RepID=A0A495RIJ7_9GAMM|nr:FAD-binding and (Fe-S)-binding domain-containing protein [Orbus hercynius]RKS87245.1 FAD/FMN-containing dehydrogenase [Orbus hercynius]